MYIEFLIVLKFYLEVKFMFLSMRLKGKIAILDLFTFAYVRMLSVCIISDKNLIILTISSFSCYNNANAMPDK
jgi:hypothetical protein